jgi:hypothetical protein
MVQRRNWAALAFPARDLIATRRRSLADFLPSMQESASSGRQIRGQKRGAEFPSQRSLTVRKVIASNNNAHRMNVL